MFFFISRLFILFFCSLSSYYLPPSDQVLNPLLAAAHLDGRYQLNISGSELTVSTPTGSMTWKQCVLNVRLVCRETILIYTSIGPRSSSISLNKHHWIICLRRTKPHSEASFLLTDCCCQTNRIKDFGWSIWIKNGATCLWSYPPLVQQPVCSHPCRLNPNR